MEMKNIQITAIIAAAVSSIPMTVMAATCDSYPYTNGMNIENVSGGVKILATSAAEVDFDDIDSVGDARTEATLAAKAEISKFFTQTISSEESVSRAIQVTKSMQGNSKTAAREETKKIVKSYANSSRSLLRGVVVLGECYTPGRELRVSVGVKPESVAQAKAASGAMGGGAGSGEAGRAQPPETKTLQNVQGYSDTSR
jgi:hypothetical protein